MTRSSVSSKPENADIVSQLFLTLPDSYDAIVTALENLPEEQMTLNTIKSRLLAEELKKKNRNAEEEDRPLTAFTAKNKRRFNGKCHKCGKFGHTKKDCQCSRNNRID